MMIKVIVTTTINKPTEAIEKFQEFKDWILVEAPAEREPEAAPEVEEDDGKKKKKKK